MKQVIDTISEYDSPLIVDVTYDGPYQIQATTGLSGSISFTSDIESLHIKPQYISIEYPERKLSKQELSDASEK